MENSPLGALAPGLRNKIWEYALIQEHLIAFTHHARDERLLEIALEIPLEIRNSNLIALLQVCRQTKSEGTKMFYPSNTFRLKVLGCPCERCIVDPASTLTSALRNFLHLLHVNRALVKTIVVSSHGVALPLAPPIADGIKGFLHAFNLLREDWHSELDVLQYEIPIFTFQPRATEQAHADKREPANQIAKFVQRCIFTVDVFDWSASIKKTMDEGSAALDQTHDPKAWADLSDAVSTLGFGGVFP